MWNDIGRNRIAFCGGYKKGIFGGGGFLRWGSSEEELIFNPFAVRNVLEKDRLPSCFDRLSKRKLMIKRER